MKHTNRLVVIEWSLHNVRMGNTCKEQLKIIRADKHFLWYAFQSIYF